MSAIPAVNETAPETPRANGALAALFARIARGTERPILAINDAAQEKDNQAPAFYCVHSLSGAGGTDFSHLATSMPAVRFYGIQAPPTKMKDPAFSESVDAIASYYADALIKFQPTGPFLLGGWSAGAIIGLEIAQKLRARGRMVRLYAAIDAAPENTSGSLPYWHPHYAVEFAFNALGWFVNDVVMTKGSLRAFFRRGLNKAKARRKSFIGRRGGSEETIDVDAVDTFMDISRYADYERSFMNRLYVALVSYKAKKYAGAVVAYEAKKKPLLHLPQVARVWRAIAPRSTIVRLKGTHLSILQPGDVNALATDLQKRLIAVAADLMDHEAPPPEMPVSELEQKTA